MPELSAIALEILAGSRSTQERWSVLVEGVRFYRPERHALHERIATSFLGGTTVQKSPRGLVLAGGPASGKTRLRGVIALPPKPVLLDADSVKTMLPEYGELLEAGEKLAALLVHEESADIASAVLERAMAEQRNLVLDAVGDSKPGKFIAKLELLRQAGYAVEVVYADVSEDVAVARAAERGRRTGRVVPEDVVRELHREVGARFPEVEALDWLVSLRIYATEGDEPVLVAERRLDDSLVVHDQTKLKLFREKATP